MSSAESSESAGMPHSRLLTELPFPDGPTGYHKIRQSLWRKVWENAGRSKLLPLIIFNCLPP